MHVYRRFLDSDSAVGQDMSELGTVDKLDRVPVGSAGFGDSSAREVSCGDDDSVGSRRDTAAELGNHTWAYPASHSLGLHSKPYGRQAGLGQGAGDIHVSVAQEPAAAAPTTLTSSHPRARR